MFYGGLFFVKRRDAIMILKKCFMRNIVGGMWGVHIINKQKHYIIPFACYKLEITIIGLWLFFVSFTFQLLYRMFNYEPASRKWPLDFGPLGSWLRRLVPLFRHLFCMPIFVCRVQRKIDISQKSTAIQWKYKCIACKRHQNIWFKFYGTGFDWDR